MKFLKKCKKNGIKNLNINPFDLKEVEEESSIFYTSSCDDISLNSLGSDLDIFQNHEVKENEINKMT